MPLNRSEDYNQNLGLDFDEQDETPESRVFFTATAPEEFIGLSIGEVNRRPGRLAAINHSGHLTLLHGDIPANQFAPLAADIERFTNGAAKVRLRDS